MILCRLFLTSVLFLYGFCDARWTFSNVRDRSEFMVTMRDAVAKEHDMVRDPAATFHHGIMSKAQYLSSGFREEENHQESETHDWYRRRVEDADDNTNDNADDNSYYYNPQNYLEYGFNITQYSLKYHSCASLSFYNEEENQQGNSQDENIFSSLFRTQSFAILKLCPSYKCLDNSWYGCKSEYGEYMLPLENYLVASNTYQESVAYSYCNYCQQCLYFEKYFYDGGNNDTHACKYYEACSSYKSICNDYGGDDDAKDDGYINFAYEDFFECMKVDGVGDDDGYNAVFLGPYCNPNDHKTISIGVFADEWCTQYIGDQISVYDATGMAMKDDALSMHYKSTCTSCHESSLPYNIIEEDMDDSDLVVEYCEDVYMSAAKCNGNLNLPTTYASGQSYQEKVYEAMECNFIQNVVKGNYDGYGFLYIDSSNNEVYEPTLSDRVNEIKEVLTTGYDEVTKFQMFCILLFSIGSIILVITSFILKKAIYKAHNPLAHVNYDDDKIMEMRSHDNDGAFA